MFTSIKKAFSAAYTQISQKIQTLFSSNTIDSHTIKELEQLLLMADTGIVTTRVIIDEVQKAYTRGAVQSGNDLRMLLQQQLITCLDIPAPHSSSVLLLVGINGSGKTTTAAKLAYLYQQEEKKVLLAAADTFRAAAQEQLQVWAQQFQIDIVRGKPQQDPAAVVYEACQKFKEQNYDRLIIDTAGRLQTKTNLMQELGKIGRTIYKQLPTNSVNTLLTVDAVLGQNSLEQATLFHQTTPLDGIILTKMDSSAKGGIIFAITHQLHIPIMYMSFGEQIDQLIPFNAQQYVSTLLEKELFTA